MPIEINEVQSSRRVELGPQSSVELHYVIMGTTSEQDAQAALAAHAPTIWAHSPGKSAMVFVVAPTSSNTTPGTARPKTAPAWAIR